MAGANIGDPLAAPYERPQAADRSAFRIGWFDEDGRTPVTRETSETIAAAARALSSAGFKVERMQPPLATLDRARALWGVFFAKAGAALLNDVMHGAERSLPILEEWGRDSGSLTLGPRELLDAWLARDVLRAEALRDMERWRVLICPVAAIPAFCHGEREWSIDGRQVRYLDAMSYTVWFNLLGNPAAVVPVGRSREGLPIGVQVVGRPYEEALVLSVAAAIERELCAQETECPPPLHGT